MNRALTPKCYFLPGLPHLVLGPEKNSGWLRVRKAMDQVGEEVCALKPDLLLIYSTYWPSVIGHQILAAPRSRWTHVDDEFHELGSITYDFMGDVDFAERLGATCKARGLFPKLVNYQGFPIDTGSVVVLKILAEPTRIPSVIVSSNVYADRVETVVLGKAVRETIEMSGKRVVPIVISSLSNRLHSRWIDPRDDHVSALKDQEWNLKLLEFLRQGRLEDASQLSRQFHREARVHKVSNFKPLWWLSAVMGQTNLFSGDVLAYEPIYGSGAAVVGLTPAEKAHRDLEFDEDDPETYSGERNVLGGGGLVEMRAPEMGPLSEVEDEPQV